MVILSFDNNNKSMKIEYIKMAQPSRLKNLNFLNLFCSKVTIWYTQIFKKKKNINTKK